MKELKRRLIELENKIKGKDLTIEEAIDQFPKDIYLYGFDLNLYLRNLGFTLEQRISYAFRNKLGINLCFNAKDYRSYEDFLEQQQENDSPKI